MAVPEKLPERPVAGHAKSAKAGKYLTFQLSDEIYGIELLVVQEIIGMMKVTRIPGAPIDVRGVINLRGKVIPVVDLRQKFNLEETEDTPMTCITVVQTGQRGTTGIVVDLVREVMNVEDSQIEPPPAFGNGYADNNFILALAKVGNDVVTLLDIEKILADDIQAIDCESGSEDALTVMDEM